MTDSLLEAKARLFALVTLAEAGEEIEITRHGEVVVRLVSAAAVHQRPGSAGA